MAVLAKGGTSASRLVRTICDADGRCFDPADPADRDDAPRRHRFDPDDDERPMPPHHRRYDPDDDRPPPRRYDPDDDDRPPPPPRRRDDPDDE